MLKFNLSQVKLGFSFIQINLNLLFKGLRLNRSVRQSFDCLNYSLWIFQGFSLFSYQCSLLSVVYDSFVIISNSQVFVNNFFKKLFQVILSDINRATRIRTLKWRSQSPLPYHLAIALYNAEGGIRTHAPLRTNGFQDRLVMTTSIPLHESGWWESNPRIQLGRLVFYHWTTPACSRGDRIRTCDLLVPNQAL